VTEAIGAFAHTIPKPGTGYSPRTALPIFDTNNFPKINFRSSKPRGHYTGCHRRNVPDFGRVFLMLKYTDITQNTHVQS